MVSAAVAKLLAIGAGCTLASGPAPAFGAVTSPSADVGGGAVGVGDGAGALLATGVVEDGATCTAAAMAAMMAANAASMRFVIRVFLSGKEYMARVQGLQPSDRHRLPPGIAAEAFAGHALTLR